MKQGKASAGRKIDGQEALSRVLQEKWVQR
jgi:hypothetical protein